MRIIERVARLEKAGNADPRMSMVEIAAAADRFEATLARYGAPVMTTEDRAKAGWRACVEAPGPGWRQRVFADMEPEDFFA